MGNVFLFIDGLSASYYKDGLWNVVFPCDSDGNHSVLFGYHKRGSSPVKPVSLVDKKIQITTDKAIAPTDPRSNNFNLVLDLTSNDFHKEGVRFVAKPSIKKSVLTIEDALFYTAETKRRHNYVENLTAGTGAKPIQDETASLIGVQIELAPGGSVTFEVDGMPELKEKFEDGDLLYIDNDCAGCTVFESDFDLYQEIFENSSDKNIKFKLLSYSLSPFPLGAGAGLKMLFAGPPPAFCDGFQIGKTGDL